MFDISELKIDNKAAEEGTWSQPLKGGLRLRIARWNNSRYNNFIRKHGRGAASGRSNPLAAEPEENFNDLMMRAAAETVLLDWENMVEGGQRLDYSSKEALRLFRTYPEFFQIVLQMANDTDFFRTAVQEDDLGNSPGSSDGESDS